MLEDLFVAFWFFIPAGIANMAPIFAARIPVFKRFDLPVDGGRTFRGVRLLGANKTWRGFVAGIILATIAFGLQQLAIAWLPWLHDLTSQIDYSVLPTLIIGPLFAIGALGGDAVESFFKRQLRIPPGHSWFPFDQTDYIIGGALVMLPFIILSPWQYIWLIILWLALHLIVSYIGWLLKLKDKPI